MIHQILPTLFYTYPLFFVLNQPSSTKKGGHPPWVPASKLYTAAMPPIAHSRYAHSCKLAFVLAEGIAKHKPIEEKDYWEEEGEFEGVE